MASKARRLYDAMLRRKVFKPRGWDRAGVLDIFVNGNRFGKLPAYSAADLSPEAVAQRNPKGIPVPAEAFARKNESDEYAMVEPDDSMKNALRGWYRNQVFPKAEAIAKAEGIVIPALPHPDEIEMHLARDDKGKRFVMVYRKG